MDPTADFCVFSTFYCNFSTVIFCYCHALEYISFDAKLYKMHQRANWHFSAQGEGGTQHFGFFLRFLRNTTDFGDNFFVIA